MLYTKGCNFRCPYCHNRSLVLNKALKPVPKVMEQLAVRRGFSDGVVITGSATAQPAGLTDVQAAKDAVHIPVTIGSGLTPENLAQYWPHADAFIVGSYIKSDGLWCNPIDPARLARFMDSVRRLRGG